MILSFSTKDKNGKPTNFVEKIWLGLEQISPIYKQYSKEWFKLYFNKFGRYWDVDTRLAPKKHTIREDKHDRWHAGVLIHFIIFPRTKKMFQFAPIMPCVSTQRIDIYETGDGTEIFIDGRCLDENEAELLAKNDGFEDAEDMLNWFDGGIEDWKIIHWTDLKY
jgi:hypothetical protein